MPANSWDLDPATKFIASLGQKALADGTVSPQDAMQTYSSLSNVAMGNQGNQVAPGGPSGVAMGTPPPFALTNPLGQNPMLSRIDLSKPNAHASEADTAKQSNNHSTKQTQWITPEQAQSASDTFNSLPGVQDQKEGIQKIQDATDRYNDMQSRMSHMDWSPLMALADSQKPGGKLLEGYKAPQSAQDAAKTQLALLSGVQDKKQQLSKDLLDFVKNAKAGSVQDAYMASLTNANNAGIGSPQGGGSGLGNARRNALIAASGNDFDKDKVLGQMTQTTNNLNRASSIMNGNTPVTVQMFNDIQKDLANALAPGGAATEGNMNRTLLTTLAGNLNALQSKFGDVQDLRKAQPQIFAQLQGFINQVKDEYARAGADRLQMKAANWRQVPDDAIQKTVDDKIGKYQQFFGPPGANSAGQKIKVSNGKETLMIDPRDLADAQKEGYNKL